jgi:hypothetical protein
VAEDHASQLIDEIEQSIADCRARSVIDHDGVCQIRQKLVDAAVTIFGPASIEATEANITILTDDALRQLENNPNLPRAISPDDNVPRIFEIPRASRSEYYRKRLEELAELATAFSIPRRARD